MEVRLTLDARLAAAGVRDATDPVSAWRQLREVEGPTATVIDLYELEGRRRGLEPWELPVSERHALARSVMAEVWPGWSVTSGSARGGDTIVVCEYDPEWLIRYGRWREILVDSLGDVAIGIEHIGSTSVPGLPAKPIIDVQVSVADLSREDLYVPPLESVGLQLRSRDDLHRYFRPFPHMVRDIHVHVCEAGSLWEAEHLEFRDFLRAHPEACARYAQAKRDAVTHWADDGFAYTDAKTGVILEILREARDAH
jgi:GrpB-like predicted nucleotidyltransferase (UPF0157 family)